MNICSPNIYKQSKRASELHIKTFLRGADTTLAADAYNNKKDMIRKQLKKEPYVWKQLSSALQQSGPARFEMYVKCSY